ncbi:MAG: DeoR/GlpR transcriptional regulator, partial [Chloroflexi bacterium]|nr:DeoR/GlpR transcriptional regulator [Chloroflexota bacterium]
MIPAARRSKILDILKQRSAVSITDLEALLNVSPATIRRDLDILSDQHHLRRTHGGAIVEEALNTTAEPDHEVQFLQMQEEKHQIGLAAAGLVEDGQSLILDSSSTVLELALALNGHRDLTVVTNDVMIARVLTDSPCIASLIVTGGTLRKHHYTLGGMATADLISGLRVDTAFLGVHAIDDEVASETDIGVAQIKTLMASAARRVVVLADH